ncbi:MAG TPA: DUF3179 domain-containing (seleno)protein [Candidatus Polarisedimenticolaceae bacterium]|nr:DUF3179 domain-containing (seleno)protein [Candidatus Polarisedimenticolaceae bacterium]
MSGARRRLDWLSGGWVLLLAGSLVAGIVAWRVVPILLSSSRAVGDGRNVATYGFALEPLDVPRETLAASGFAKDGIPALVDPAVMRGDAVRALNDSRRGKYLVSDDRVIGVVLDGQTRAYPLRVLNWHEVVNDTLAGRPIAVTYHPLCDGAVVFDREVAGEVVEFGVSGLLSDSNLLMFDRRADAEEESLWSQLLARAVAGPAAAAGHRLDVLPASLARWDVWLDTHPDTTVLEPEPRLFERYERNPYGNYFLTGRLRFPADPLPPDGSHPWMQPIVVVERAGVRWQRLLGSSGGTATIEPLPGVRLRLDESTRPGSVLVEAPPGVAVFYSLWFAWYATHPPGAQ